jgi:hypothetical protein
VRVVWPKMRRWNRFFSLLEAAIFDIAEEPKAQWDAFCRVLCNTEEEANLLGVPFADEIEAARGRFSGLFV